MTKAELQILKCAERLGRHGLQIYTFEEHAGLTESLIERGFLERVDSWQAKITEQGKQAIR